MTGAVPETSFGLEFGGGIASANPRLGLSLDVEGRTLLSVPTTTSRRRGGGRR